MTTAKDKTKANGATPETAVVVAENTGVEVARKAPIQTVCIDVNGLSGSDDIGICKAIFTRRRLRNCTDDVRANEKNKSIVK